MASPQAGEPPLPCCLSLEVEESWTRNPSAPIAVEIRDKDLFGAASSGDTSLFRTLSPEQLSRVLSLRDKDGFSLLYAAARNDRYDVAKFLLEADRSRTLINAQEKRHQYAPIHTACCRGYVEMVELLCVNGADVNLKGQKMYTPLHLAASFGRVKVAEVLIRFGAEINAKSETGCIPLHKATRTLEFCELLINAGSEIDVADQAGQTPLTHAVILNSKEVALLLMSHGADMSDKVEYEMLGRYPADYKDGESRPRDLKKRRRSGPVRLSGCSAAVNTCTFDPGLLSEGQIRRLACDALSHYNKKRGL